MILQTFCNLFICNELTSHFLVYMSVSSEDDPFLLYATLHSGNHCQFASKDLMRDHKACLPDAATRQLFFKWQRGHQLVVDGDVSAHTRVRFQVRKRRKGVWGEWWRKKHTNYLNVNVSVCVFRLFPAMTPLSRLQPTRGTFPTMTQRTGAAMKYHNVGSALPRSRNTHAHNSYALIMTVDL